MWQRCVKAVLVLSVVAAAGAQASWAQESPLWGDLEPGPYRVGFQALYRLDGTRSYFAQPGGEEGAATTLQGRPVRIMVWYPASDRGVGEPLTFGDYLDVKPRSSHFAQYNRMLQARDKDTARRQFTHANPESLLAILSATATAAYLDVPAAQGSFPLVLHSLGRNDYQAESTVLWEYLASHGYVVANVPQLGPNPLDDRLAFSLPDLELQLGDLAFALNELRRFPNVDKERAVVMGHSSGGLVALMLAGANRSVDAVVGLDASFVTHDGNDLMFGWPAFDLSRLRLPVLNCFSAYDEERVSFTLLDTLDHCDRVHMGWVKGTHFDFQNWPLYSTLTGVDDPRGLGFREASTGKEIYLSLCREVEGFLWTVFNGTEEEITALGAPGEAKELSDSLPARRYQKGRRVPFPEDIAQLYYDRRPDEARRVAEEARQRYPDEAVLTTADINMLSSRLTLMRDERLALDALQLGVDLDTLSVERRYLLAEGLLAAEQTGAAVAQYQMILKLVGEDELDPESLEAKLRGAAGRRLTELGWEPEPLEEEESSEEAAVKPEN
jgi:pimeloyl-ACP methyl ester carboxylesterase